MSAKRVGAPPRSRRRVGLGCGCGVGLALVGLVLAYVLGRDPLVTWVVERELTKAGVACTPQIELDVSWDLAHATLAPARCTLPADAGVAAVTWHSPVDVDLDGLRPVNVRAEAVELELRFAPPSPPPGEMPGPLAVLAGARGAILELMKQGARASERDLGRASATDLSFVYEDVTVARFRGVTLESVSGELDVHADDVVLAGVNAGIDGLDAELTPRSGVASASLDIEVGLGVANVRRTVRATLRGNELDGPAPTLEASVGTPL